MSGATGSSEFRERARLEANRYGPDPWVFVRELLQNARDAGAREVRFDVTEDAGMTRIRCVDDGEGMSYEHARRYLFSLYASSKEDASNQVGRFGVGFWSVLRFDPSRIVIRSRQRDSPAWEIALDGALEHANRSTPQMELGTEVVLEKAFSDGSQVRRVRDAASQNARFLCMRDHPEVPLRIVVNGKRINAAFALPPPSASFRRGRVRGVVGLGAAPRVELFSRGLRVRSAACLDDLLSSSGHTSHSRVRFPELPGALAPQALLESEGLELLLSRSDARENRSLRKLVKLANLELERLVDRQLAQVRPPGLWERITGLRRRLLGDSLAPRVALAVAGGVALALGCARLLWGPDAAATPGGGRPALAVSGAPPVEVLSDGRGYGDLASRYRGPRVSELDPTVHAEPVPLTYTPADRRPFFAALVVSDLEGGAAPIDRDPSGRPRAYSGLACAQDCLEVRLELDAKPGPVRVPVPTGHRLDVASLRVGDEASPVFRTTNDEPVLVLDTASQQLLSYRTGPAPSPTAASPAFGELPRELRQEARRVRNRPLDARVAALVDVVEKRVRYSTSREVAALHHEAILAGEPFMQRTLRIGAGDCDVQNTLLAALLQTAEVPARLAVGHVGTEGKVAPWLHAWAEYRDADGWWHVADASRAPAAASAAGGPVAMAQTGPPATGPGPTAPGAGPAASSPGPLDPDPQPSTVGVDDGPAFMAETEPTSALAVVGELQPAPARGPDRWTVGVISLLAGAFGLVLFGIALRRRTRRSFRLDESGDISRLLHGALQRPAAFRHLPALFHRKLIPLAGGNAISLSQARELAGRGKLYRSLLKRELAAKAIRRRVEVLDDESAEARTVGDTLGATDLDRWSELLDRARKLPVLERINAYLRDIGERWEVRAIESGSDAISSLDLHALGIGGPTRRVVLIPSRDPWLLEAEDRAGQHPAMAALLLLDHVLERLNITPDLRARLLAPQALAAVQEARR